MKRLLALLLLVLAGAALAAPRHHSAPPTVTLHGHRFTAELATDDASRIRGLMMRAELPADHGMLFIFPDSAPRWFWMKSTLVALDILYFDDTRRLVSMQLDVPPCKADPCASYPSSVPARYVLEVPAGTTQRIGAQTGDVLTVDGEIGPVH
ncbi:DUF192 domain-containing protein [Frateuria defendens]|uniref:DUF192 domain-containing protein n=1 Tax=Frateuria defendens TaxID=2219559 RepID=UPI00066FB4F3|nr:DUF192 domain-containing protein [Frateuria defendens]